MRLYRFIILGVMCCLLAACKDNNRHMLKISRNLPDYYVTKSNGNLVIYSEHDTLVNLVLKDGEYLAKENGLVVLANRNYDGYYSDKADEFTSIVGNKKTGFCSRFRVAKEYIEVKYDSCYNIRSINKTNRITYGEQFPDDIDEDILLVDTLFLNKQIGSVIW